MYLALSNCFHHNEAHTLAVLESDQAADSVLAISECVHYHYAEKLAGVIYPADAYHEQTTWMILYSFAAYHPYLEEIYDTQNISSIVDNKLHMTTTEGYDCSTWCKIPQVGDFDIVCPVYMTEFGFNTATFFLFISDLYGREARSNFLRLRMYAETPPNRTWRSWGNESTEQDVGGNIELVPPGAHGWRVRRVGSVWTVWYWSPLRNQWEWNGNPAGRTMSETFTDLVYIGIVCYSLSSGTDYTFDVPWLLSKDIELRLDPATLSIDNPTHEVFSAMVYDDFATEISPTRWIEDDPDGVLSIVGGKLDVALAASQRGYLYGQRPIEGDFDIRMPIDLTSYYSGSYFGLRISTVRNEEEGGWWQYILMLPAQEWACRGNAVPSGGVYADRWYLPPQLGGVRITRVGSTIKCFYWHENPDGSFQWEWNGNLAGRTMNEAHTDPVYLIVAAQAYSGDTMVANAPSILCDKILLQDSIHTLINLDCYHDHTAQHVEESYTAWTDFTAATRGTWTEHHNANYGTFAFDSQISPQWSDINIALGCYLSRHYSVRWNDHPVKRDMEVLARVCAEGNTTSQLTRARVHVRTNYWTQLDLDNNLFELHSYVSVGVTDELATHPHTLTQDTWYWVRLRIVNDRITAKIWDEGAPEPATWDIDVTDTTWEEEGYVCLGQFTPGGSQADKTLCDVFSVAYGQETAPYIVNPSAGDGIDNLDLVDNGPMLLNGIWVQDCYHDHVITPTNLTVVHVALPVALVMTDGGAYHEHEVNGGVDLVLTGRQWFDFSEYAHLEVPGDWTECWDVAVGSMEVRTDSPGAKYGGGKVLRLTTTANDFYGVYPANCFVAIDFDIVARVKSLDTDTAQAGTAVRMGGTEGGGDSDGYLTLLNTFGNQFRVGKLVNEVWGEIAAPSHALADDVWYWVRLQVRGDAIKAKFWADDAAEPGAWAVETTDSDITDAQRAGLFQYGTSERAEFDVLTIVTGGADALVPLYIPDGYCELVDDGPITLSQTLIPNNAYHDLVDWTQGIWWLDDAYHLHTVENLDPADSYHTTFDPATRGSWSEQGDPVFGDWGWNTAAWATFTENVIEMWNGREGCMRWNDVPATQCVEIVCKFQFNSAGFEPYGMIIYPKGYQKYGVLLNWNTEEIRLVHTPYYTTGGTDLLTPVTLGFSLDDNTSYWMKVRMWGPDLKAKVWQDGNPEPGAWDIEVTDTTYTAAGTIGYGNLGTGGHLTKLDFISVSTGRGREAQHLLDPENCYHIHYAEETYCANWIQPDYNYHVLEDEGIISETPSWTDMSTATRGTWQERWNGTFGAYDWGTRVDPQWANISWHGWANNGYNFAVSWNTPGQYKDVEILARISGDSNAANPRIFGRLSGSNAYYVTLDIDNDLFNLEKGLAEALLDSDSVSLAQDTWYWVKLRLWHSEQKAKIWADGTPEPAAWNVEAADTDVTGVGYVALGCLGTGLQYPVCDFLIFSKHRYKVPFVLNPGGDNNYRDYFTHTAENITLNQLAVQDTYHENIHDPTDLTIVHVTGITLTMTDGGAYHDLIDWAQGIWWVQDAYHDLIDWTQSIWWMQDAYHDVVTPWWWMYAHHDHVVTPTNLTLEQTGAVIDLVMTDGGAFHLHIPGNVVIDPAWVYPADTFHLNVVPDQVWFVQFAYHDHVVTPTDLTVVERIAVTPNDCYHDHLADNVIIDPAWVYPNDTFHLDVVTPSDLTLTEVVTLAVNGAYHDLISPELPAAQVYPGDAYHLHVAEAADVFSVLGTYHLHVVTPTDLTIVEVGDVTLVFTDGGVNYHLHVTSDPLWWPDDCYHDHTAEACDLYFKYITDFSEYALDAQPADWTERWNPATGDAQVKTSTGTFGGKQLTIVDSSLYYWSLSWDDIGLVEDGEILVLARIPAANEYIIIRMRGSGAAGAEYSAGVKFSPYGELQFVDIENHTVGGHSGPTYQYGPIDYNTWYFIRYKLIGDKHYNKVWDWKDEEPVDWSNSGTDSDISGAGWVGIGTWDETVHFDYFGFVTGDNTVPLPFYPFQAFHAIVTTPANLTLEEVNVLVVQDTYHPIQSSYILGMTQEHYLTMVDGGAYHLHVVIPTDLSFYLITADTYHDLVTNVDDSPLAITQEHNLTNLSAFHVHVGEDFALTQEHNLTVQGAYNEIVDTGPVLLFEYEYLTVADCWHELVGAVDVTQLHILGLDACYHLHVLPPPLAITQEHNLTAQDAFSLHVCPILSLTQEHTLIVATAFSLHVVPVIELGLHLVISSCYHETFSDTFAFTQEHNLTVAGDFLLHVPDNVAIVVPILVEDCAQEVTSDLILLTALHFLTVVGTYHVHVVTGLLVLFQLHFLEVAGTGLDTNYNYSLVFSTHIDFGYLPATLGGADLTIVEWRNP